MKNSELKSLEMIYKKVKVDDSEIFIIVSR